MLCGGEARALHLVSKAAGIDITTNKVIRIQGRVDPDMDLQHYIQVALTRFMPGPRVTVIDSGGGLVASGRNMIVRMEEEKAHGVRQICVVMGQASSMAFNILTHCDVRLATVDSTALVHKIAVDWVPPGGPRLTAKQMHENAVEMEREDYPFSRDNAKAMGLRMRDYDKFADQESTWTARELYDRGYLHGLVRRK